MTGNILKEYAKVERVVNAAINNCMYVLIDWHYTDSTAYPDKAVEFFSRIIKLCAGKCNCLYETWNEPKNNDWSAQLKPYHETVINVAYEFLNNNRISYINWAVDDKSEQSAALQPNSVPADVCSDAKLSTSGEFVKRDLTTKNAKPQTGECADF
uniref:Cellulase domain-containing protein n=1 Tax=Globodera pallida TaxID=36090 RepID=A0A183CKQ1_GLOPA